MKTSNSRDQPEYRKLLYHAVTHHETHRFGYYSIRVYYTCSSTSIYPHPFKHLLQNDYGFHYYTLHLVVLVAIPLTMVILASDSLATATTASMIGLTLLI